VAGVIGLLEEGADLVDQLALTGVGLSPFGAEEGEAGLLEVGADALSAFLGLAGAEDGLERGGGIGDEGRFGDRGFGVYGFGLGGFGLSGGDGAFLAARGGLTRGGGRGETGHLNLAGSGFGFGGGKLWRGGQGGRRRGWRGWWDDDGGFAGGFLEEAAMFEGEGGQQERFDCDGEVGAHGRINSPQSAAGARGRRCRPGWRLRSRYFHCAIGRRDR